MSQYARPRHIPAVALTMAVLLLAACSGGGDPAEPEPVTGEPTVEAPPAFVYDEAAIVDSLGDIACEGWLTISDDLRTLAVTEAFKNQAPNHAFDPARVDVTEHVTGMAEVVQRRCSGDQPPVFIGGAIDFYLEGVAEDQLPQNQPPMFEGTGLVETADGYSWEVDFTVSRPSLAERDMASAPVGKVNVTTEFLSDVKIRNRTGGHNLSLPPYYSVRLGWPADSPICALVEAEVGPNGCVLQVSPLIVASSGILPPKLDTTLTPGQQINASGFPAVTSVTLTVPEEILDDVIAALQNPTWSVAVGEFESNLHDGSAYSWGQRPKPHASSPEGLDQAWLDNSTLIRDADIPYWEG